MPSSRFHDMLTTMPTPVMPSKLCCTLTSRFLPLCLYPSPRCPAFSVIACLLQLCPLLSYPLSLSCCRPSKSPSSPHAVETSCPLPFALRFFSCFVGHNTRKCTYLPSSPKFRKPYTAILCSLPPSIFRLFPHPNNETLVQFISLFGWSYEID